MPHEPDQLPLVLHQGVELGNALRAYRELDRDVMEPELVRAIDDYLWHGAQWGMTSYQLTKAHLLEEREGYAGAESAVVRAARAFGEVLARHDPQGRLTFEDLTLSAMREHSENMRRGRWEWYADQRGPSTG